MHRLPADLDAIARDELAPGESVEWAAQPDATRAALASFGIWLFAVPWTAFSVFWMAMASLAASDGAGAGAAFPLFGVPFVLIGLAMLSAPLWAWRAARRTLYAVTDRRAILFESSGGRAISVRSLEPRALRNPRRTERPDGSGSLVFASAALYRGSQSTPEFSFANIPDVRAAHDAVAFLAATHDWTAEERQADLMDDAVEAALGPDRLRARS